MTPAVPPRVLFVCEGNICRSPYAMVAFSELWSATEGTPAAPLSAGTRAPLGAGAHEQLRRFFVEPRSVAQLDAHRSRRMDAGLIRGVDLVLTMERGHRRDVLALVPGALRRTYTLGEFAQVARAAIESDVELHGMSLDDIAGRFRLAARGAADITDPVRGDASDFADMAHSVDDALKRVVALLHAVAPRP